MGVMPRQNYDDPKVTQLLDMMKVEFPLFVAVICITIYGLHLWRLQHFKHAVATIETVWEKEVSRRGVVTMAELSFTRTASAGNPIECRYNFEIGKPRDGFKVGDKLDIVPATGTCQRADIIGRSEQGP